MSFSPTPGARARRVPGAQSLDRAMGLLALVAAGQTQGTSLRTLVDATGLDRTTAWRMLASLEHHGVVARDEASGLYRLGLEAMAWGAACMERPPLIEACRPLMKTLVRRSGESVFLVVRSGDYSHCLHLEQGVHPVRGFAMNVGTTRLLGLGVASIALLARLDDAALAQHYARHADEYRSHDIGLARLQRFASQTREQGHSHTGAGGVAGVGLRFRMGSCGEAAMSIIAPRTRMPRSRGEELARLLRAQLAG